MKRTILALSLVCVMLANGLAQQPTLAPAPSTQQPEPTEAAPPPPLPLPSPTPDPNDSNDDDVVRITTNLLQLDVVVTDKNDKQVTDLKAEDFEVFENGKSRTITNFSYVNTAPETPMAGLAGAAPTPAPTPRDKSMGPITPPQRLRPEQVRRAIALVVDDLRMSAESINATRTALRKYVNEQVQAGDLVAIVRTSAGIGALQQFTGDRMQLYASIDRVRMLARSGARAGAFTSVNMLDRLAAADTDSMSMERDGESATDRRRREGLNTGGSDTAEDLTQFRDSLFTVGTVGALNFVVRGLKQLPGRKAVVLLSDGISIFNQNATGQNRNERVLSALQQLVDNANRASVVFYAVDTRGLQPSGFTAADSTAGAPISPGNSGPDGSVFGVSSIQPDMAGMQVFGSRSGEMFEGQNGLNYLSRETGGLALFNNNDLNKGIRRALDDISGFYLIGYRPEGTTFDPATRGKYNSWTVKVKNRPGLKVRTRKGFVGVAEEENRVKGRRETLMSALLSPFAASGVKMVLTSFFMNDATIGSAMRSVVLMDANNLTFTAQPDGQLQTVLDIVAVTLGEDGQVVDQTSRFEKILVRPELLARFQKEGMVYGLNVPVSKPGAYQLRVAVRDAGTGRVGSASQYVEVPQVGKDRLILSSLVISGNKPQAPRSTGTALLSAILGKSRSSLQTAGGTAAAATTATVVPGGEGMLGSEDPEAGPASRRFRHGMYLDYACIIYNGKSAQKKGPKLTTQVRLFRDGQEVFVGRVRPVDMGMQADLARPVVARRLQLGTILDPGEYVLHLTVKDGGTPGEKGTATRWIDFEVLK